MSDRPSTSFDSMGTCTWSIRVCVHGAGHQWALDPATRTTTPDHSDAHLWLDESRARAYASRWPVVGATVQRARP